MNLELFQNALEQVIEQLEARQQMPDVVFYIDTESGINEMEVDSSMMSDPECGLIFLAVTVADKDASVFTSLRHSYEIINDANALFNCRFRVRDENLFSASTFIHYAMSVLSDFHRKREKIVINQYIPKIH